MDGVNVGKGEVMTLDERVEAIHAEIFTSQIKNIKPIIRRALIEQDKITLHACDIKVAMLVPATTTPGPRIACVSADAVREAIMNCRGGVE